MMLMEGICVGKGSIIRVSGCSADGGDFQIKILMLLFVLMLLIKIMLTAFSILLTQCSWEYKHATTYLSVI